MKMDGNDVLAAGTLVVGPGHDVAIATPAGLIPVVFCEGEWRQHLAIENGTVVFYGFNSAMGSAATGRFDLPAQPPIHYSFAVHTIGVEAPTRTLHYTLWRTQAERGAAGSA